MAALGIDAQVATLAHLLIACGAAEEPPELLRASAIGSTISIPALDWLWLQPISLTGDVARPRNRG